MDFRFTAEDEAWRQEIRDFLKAELPADWAERGPMGEGESDAEWEFSRAFSRKLAARHWIAIAWPKEYGGLGATYMQQMIFAEEMAMTRAPGGGGLGVVTAGPGIILYGSEEQKRRHIRGITSAETWWCVGFSEPNAGSDLAGLQTRAVEDGDDFVVSGSKIWNSGGHRADWCYLAARTDPDMPKHRGISLLLVEMNSPGIRVRPIITMGGHHVFNQVYFEDVHVPRENLLGEKNHGWYQVAASLDVERTNMSTITGNLRTLADYIAYARQTRRNGRTLAEDPDIRQRIAELRIEVEVGRMLAYRVVSMQTAGLIPNREASAVKLWGSETRQHIAALGMLLAGPYGALTPRAARAPLGGRIADTSLGAVSATIAAGTSEIQRNIIAQRGLGLPR
jgi:alkylation response protein AidB-like acyl-CoA dehydrogenase